MFEIRKMLQGLVLAAALLAPASPALAGVSVEPAIRVGVGVNLGFDPWLPGAVGPVRSGYVWAPGHYDAMGFWVPGHYRPALARPGYVYVPGYWRGRAFVDGYWRPAYPATAWVPGHYAGRGWVRGHWGRV